VWRIWDEIKIKYKKGVLAFCKIISIYSENPLESLHELGKRRKAVE
jgi:hypothetical protein